MDQISSQNQRRRMRWKCRSDGKGGTMRPSTLPTDLGNRQRTAISHISTARRRLGFMMTIQLCTADDIRALQQQDLFWCPLDRGCVTQRRSACNQYSSSVGLATSRTEGLTGKQLKSFKPWGLKDHSAAPNASSPSGCTKHHPTAQTPPMLNTALVARPVLCLITTNSLDTLPNIYSQVRTTHGRSNLRSLSSPFASTTELGSSRRRRRILLELPCDGRFFQLPLYAFDTKSIKRRVSATPKQFVH
jgi:hypothetical protein